MVSLADVKEMHASIWDLMGNNSKDLFPYSMDEKWYLFAECC